MANEIVAGEIRPTDREGAVGVITLTFFYPIATPATVGGANVVETPSSSLPSIPDAVWSTAKKTDLDNGDAAFESVSMAIPDGATNQELVARAQTIYSNKQSEYLSRYNERYKFAGATADSV